jgi:two-component system, NarL family, nitrate/nitrite response regulator NarL
MATNVCLVGRRHLFRAGLKHILDNELFRVGLELDGLAALDDLSAADCPLVIVDEPEEIRDIEADIRRLKAAAPRLRLVVLADAMESDQLALSFAAGVDGYLLADISPAALCESLRLVMLGEKVFPSRMVSLLAELNWPVQSPAQQLGEAGSLSDREVEIVSQLAVGSPNKVIADHLTITEATVKVHLKSILKKLGVSNRTQAAVWAINHGVAIGTRMPVPAR